VGSRQLDLDIPSGATVNDLLERLESRYPGFRRYRSILLMSVNEEYVDRHAVISDGDEVALFPPVSGGASPEATLSERPREVYRLTREPIDARGIAELILRPEDGALCVFEGVVRNNSKGKTTRYLEYDWVAHPGDFIYETPGTVHTLVSDHPEGVKLFGWLQGPLEFFDEKGAFVETLDVWWFINHYETYCRENGIPINPQLYI